MSHDNEIWAVLNPINFFRLRPSDFPETHVESAACMGPTLLPGLVSLAAIHVACFDAFYQYGASAESGPWAKWWCLVPVAVLWALFGSADLKFRFQGANRTQRTEFDRGFLSWLGLVTVLAGLFVFIPVSVLWGVYAAFLWLVT